MLSSRRRQPTRGGPPACRSVGGTTVLTLIKWLVIDTQRMSHLRGKFS
jgi:hypothetical protein